MNSDEVSIIKRTWQIPSSQPVEAGTAILTTFFIRHPSNLEKFSFKDVPIPELKNSARFKAHCTRIIRTFDDSIKLLDHDNPTAELQQIWQGMTINHLKRNIPRESYDQLKAIILEVLTETCKLNEQEQQVWEKLIDTVYNIIYQTLKENNVQ